VTLDAKFDPRTESLLVLQVVKQIPFVSGVVIRQSFDVFVQQANLKLPVLYGVNGPVAGRWHHITKNQSSQLERPGKDEILMRKSLLKCLHREKDWIVAVARTNEYYNSDETQDGVGDGVRVDDGGFLDDSSLYVFACTVYTPRFFDGLDCVQQVVSVQMRDYADDELEDWSHTEWLQLR
jgi:hypothetical protein